MRTFGLLLIIVGGYLAAQTWLPSNIQLRHFLTLPALPVSLLMCGGAICAFGVLLTLIPKRSAPSLNDDIIRQELLRRGFAFTTEPHGWRAQGQWEREPIQIRRVSGYEASRFGRPWIIEISLKGVPLEPWPFVPEQGKVIDVRDHGFSVTIPELSYEGAQGLFSSRVDAIVASRRG